MFTHLLTHLRTFVNTISDVLVHKFFVVRHARSWAVILHQK